MREEAAISFEELKAWLVLNRLGAGGLILEALRSGTKAVQVLDRILSENWCRKEDRLAKLLADFDPQREIEACDEKGIRCLPLFDPGYPALLKEIQNPPLVLYAAGRIEDSDQAALAVVGSRHPSFYGQSQARRFASELAAAGLTLISGFAQGVDRAAHEAALQVSWGRTIAVLGCGLDVDYPKGSRKLFDQIVEKGAVLSEYALGTPPLAENFPRRNRIISGLAWGVLVVEARSRSGSLITAREAAEQGREVFAIPGPVDQPTSQGANRLIKEGAFLVEHPMEILEVLEPRLWPYAVCRSHLPEGGEAPRATGSSPKPSVEASFEEDSEEKRVAGLLAQYASLSCEEILAGSPESSPAGILSTLTRLELSGRVRKDSKGRFVSSAAPVN